MIKSHWSWILHLGCFLALLLGVVRKSHATGASDNNKDNHIPAPPRPNFVLLFMDDLGYGDVGFTGHPTTQTPNLDRLAWNGKILTTWYSGCNICTGSRAALMTGRQFPRTGVPGVFGPTVTGGLNLNETTIAEHLKQAGYATAIVGKWHLGQRPVYLPGNQGFDYYLGIPYSDDMGDGINSKCPADEDNQDSTVMSKEEVQDSTVMSKEEVVPPSLGRGWDKESYQDLGFLNANCPNANHPDDNDYHHQSCRYPVDDNDPASKFLPLVYQEGNETYILEQPLDFTTLAQKYNDFALNFLEQHQEEPFFLYIPFSHVHATSGSQPDMQYAGCAHKGSTLRGAFGDALAEADWIVGNVVKKLEELNLDENTLILFTSDNGPWLARSLSGGSEGLFTGRYAGYWDTGKGSNWEGGIREPAFAYWKGTIPPFSRSAEIMSSLDVFPTLSTLAGLDLPPNRVFDGRDASSILLDTAGKSKHDFLFFYGTCHDAHYWTVAAVRHGKYKAHWCTAPGLGLRGQNLTRHYDPPLLFNVEVDPSESIPLNEPNKAPKNPQDLEALNRILKAHAMEVATFEYGQIVPIPDGPGEGPNKYGLCCDRSKGCNCTSVGDRVGIFNLGTRRHHDKYHAALGEAEPNPPRTRAQRTLQQHLSS